jgi:hypothetical protein
MYRLTRIEMNMSSGERTKMPGMVRNKSRIRFETGIDNDFSAESIWEFYQMFCTASIGETQLKLTIRRRIIVSKIKKLLEPDLVPAIDFMISVRLQ